MTAFSDNCIQNGLSHGLFNSTAETNYYELILWLHLDQLKCRNNRKKISCTVV